MSEFSDLWNSAMSDVWSALQSGETNLAPIFNSIDQAVQDGLIVVSDAQSNILGILSGNISITDPTKGVLATFAPFGPDIIIAFNPGMKAAFPVIQWKGKQYKWDTVIGGAEGVIGTTPTGWGPVFGYLAAAALANPSRFAQVLGSLALDASDGSDTDPGGTDTSDPAAVGGTSSVPAPSTTGASSDITSTLSGIMTTIMSFAGSILSALGLGSISTALSGVFGGSTTPAATTTPSSTTTTPAQASAAAANAAAASSSSSSLWIIILLGVAGWFWYREEEKPVKKVVAFKSGEVPTA